VATVALHAPSLWTLNADWFQGVDQDLRNRALLSAGAAITLATVLLIAVAAGRRPVDTDAGSYGILTSDERPPGQPSTGAAVTAFLFLGAAALALTAWELRYWARDGWDRYWHELTGEHTMYALLQPPDAYGKWAVVALAAVAACAAVTRAPLSRPLGMTASALVLAWGAADTSLDLKAKVFENFSDRPTEEVLTILTGQLLLLAGFAALWALAGRGDSDPMQQPLRGWHEPTSPPPSW
jgi:hypothetical protein